MKEALLGVDGWVGRCGRKVGGWVGGDVPQLLRGTWRLVRRDGQQKEEEEKEEGGWKRLGEGKEARGEGCTLLGGGGGR